MVSIQTKTSNIEEKKRYENMDYMYNFKIRQNLFRKTKKAHDIVKVRKRLICPYGHYKKEYCGNVFANNKAKNFYDTKIGSIGLVLEKKEKNRCGKILFVKIISDLKKEICNDLFIVSNTRTCKHKNVYYNCSICNNSIIEICNENYIELCKKYPNNIIEKLYVYYKDIEILYEIDSCLCKQQTQYSMTKSHNLKKLELKQVNHIQTIKPQCYI
jgi:hypothetical protein